MPTAETLDILLVDDKLENLLALEAILQCADYRLIKATSGSQAIDYLRTHDCAIILLDVQMPQMDGFQTAALIKQDERSRNIPIIFLTAIDQNSQFVHRGYSAGAVDYLFKPLDPEILRSKVAVFSELYRSKEEIRRQAQLLLEREQRSEERLRFLSQTGLALSESLDYHAALVKIGRLAVPKFADSFTFHALSELDEIRTLSAAGAVPSTGQGAGDAAKDSERLAALREAVSSGRARLQTRFSDSGSGSRIIAPVIPYTRMLGAITLERGTSRELFEEADMLMAQDLAHRIAAAIDNACLYSEAESAIRARDEFLSIASHELRTPLTPLKIQTQLMRRLGQGDGAQVKLEMIRKIAETSDRQVERLSRLVDELLDVSRINVGRLALDRQPLSLPDLVNNVLEHFGTATDGQPPIQVTSTGPIVGHWDPLRLEQVITNLLTNAIKYGSGKPITISVSTDGSRAQLTVQDRGIGIAAHDQTRIFDRFERAASSRHFGGLGLGLYITKEIINSHGGTIRVQSELGSGSTFIVELPLELGAHKAEPSGSRAADRMGSPAQDQIR